MKKVLSLTLAALMLVSMIPTAMAADVDYTAGTAVEYTADSDANRAYTITVPAELQPGQSGTVTLKGKWASNETVKGTADANVVLTNSINAADTKTLDIGFAGIEKAGDNTEEKTYTEAVSVAAMPADALFGTWSGKFNYNVEFDDGVVNTVVFYDVAYDLAPGSTSNYEQMKIGSDGKVYVKLTTAGDTECDRAFGTYTADGQKLMWIPGDNTITISEDGYSFTVEYFTDGEVNASVTYQYTP